MAQGVKKSGGCTYNISLAPPEVKNGFKCGAKPPTMGPGAPGNPWPAGAGPNATRGGGLNEGQLRAGPELLFNTKVGAAPAGKAE